MSQIFNYKFIAFFLNKKKSKHLYMAVRTLYAKLKGLLRKRKKKEESSFLEIFFIFLFFAKEIYLVISFMNICSKYIWNRWVIYDKEQWILEDKNEKLMSLMSVSTIFSNIKMVINTYMFSWTYALNTLDVLFLVFKFVNTSWLFVI